MGIAGKDATSHNAQSHPVVGSLSLQSEGGPHTLASGLAARTLREPVSAVSITRWWDLVLAAAGPQGSGKVTRLGEATQGAMRMPRSMLGRRGPGAGAAASGKRAEVSHTGGAGGPRAGVSPGHAVEHEGEG